MRAGRLTVILLAVAIILLAAVPPLREEFIDACRTFNLPGTKVLPTKADYEKIALAHPQDPAIWLGFAQAVDTPMAREPQWYEGTTWDAIEAYERAILISPHSPAPRLRYALRFLADSGELGRKEERGAERQQEPLRTAAQIANFRQAEGLLKQARRLDPQNAACDYLLAYIYLAEHKDEQAFAALQAAIHKPHWDIASREAATGLLRLVDATDMAKILVPIVATAEYAAGEFPFFSRLRSLASTLVGLGEGFREKGRHKEAILCYEAAMHLGHMMRVDAYSLIEGLVAVAITSITSGPFLSEEQRQQIEKETPISQDQQARMRRLAGAMIDAAIAEGKHPERGEFNKFLRREARRDAAKWEAQRQREEQARRQTQERSKRMEEARVANFTAYLRQQGRTDLAEFYKKDITATTEWREKCREVTKQMLVPLLVAFFGGPMRYVWVVWIQAAALLGLWLLAGVISVAARYWREGHVGLKWSYGQWLLLLAATLIGGQFFVTLTKLQVIPWGIYPTDPVYFIAPLISARIGIAVWLAVALVMTLRKRARQAPDQRLGKARAYLASGRTLLPPTFAALFLVSVLGLAAWHDNMQYWQNEQRTMIEQGEVQYWGIGSANSQETSSLP